LLESAYEQCLAHEFDLRLLSAERQVHLPVRYKNVEIDCGYRLDFIIEAELIWLTEYAMISWSGTPAATPAEEAAFATASTGMLNSLSYVEKYAWYAVPPQGNFSLYNQDGTETVVGAAYKASK